MSTLATAAALLAAYAALLRHCITTRRRREADAAHAARAERIRHLADARLRLIVNVPATAELEAV